MIVWLASYPRSGNTLLREILWQTMGLPSYDEHKLNSPMTQSIEQLTNVARQAAGHIDYTGHWEAFYAQATASPELHLIKTHSPPRDAARAIYILRDGRSSCESYYHFNNSYFPQPKTSYTDVILGGVAYGDWSTHFAAWDQREHTMFVRFEELVAAGPELLAKIATFVGYKGEIRPWHNPMAELHKQVPAFFRQGDATWNAPAHWTPVINALFWACHGPLMERLGYARTSEAVTAEQLAVAQELGTLLKAGAAHRRLLQEACDERLALVQRLHNEGQTLVRANHDLHRTCQDQAGQIRELREQLEAMREMAHL